MAQYGTVPGIFNTGGFTTDLAVKDFASMIMRYMPNGNAPLFALTSMLGEETAVNTTHGYFAKARVFPEIKLTANIDNSQTQLTVDSTDNILEGMIFQFQESSENVMVLRVDDATTLTVQRGIGGGATAITIASDSPKAYQVGNAHEEGSLRPNALAITPVQITNLTQIFRNTYAITGTAEAVSVIAGDPTVSENQRDAAAFHATDIETALIFGKKGNGVRNGQPIRFMDGLINIVSNLNYYPAGVAQANVYDASTVNGGYTDSIMLENWLDSTLNQQTDPSGGNMRSIFLGGKAMRTINHICRLNGEYQLIQGQNEWGLVFNTLRMPRGTFQLIEHPLLNTNSFYSKMALVVDLATFRIAYLKNRKTQDRKFNESGATVAQDNGIDATGGTLTTECTAVVKNPPANAVIYNLENAIVDNGTP